MCSTRGRCSARNWCPLSGNGCELKFQVCESSLEGGLGPCLALSSLPWAGCTRGDRGATWRAPPREAARVSVRLVYEPCRPAWACIGRPARCAGCADAAHAVSRCVTPRKVGCVTRPPCTTAAKASCRASSRLWAPHALHILRAQRRAARRRARAEARRRCSRAALPHPWCRSAACGTRRLSRCRRTWSTHGQGVTAARRAAHERGAAACIGGGSGRNRRRRQPRLRARTLVARQSSDSTRP